MAAQLPDSGTPMTRSASTGESIARNFPARIRESYTLTPSIKLSCLPLPVPVMGLNQWM